MRNKRIQNKRLNAIHKGVLRLPFLCLMFFVWALSGCVAPQTKQVQGADDLPRRWLLNVPMIKQRDYYCGPASVGMLLEYLKQPVPQDAIAKAIYLPRAKGVLQAEIKAYIRQQGLMAYQPTASLHQLFKTLHQGRPVLVMQNLGLSLSPQWHYAVVVGYDLDKRLVYLNSGEIAQYALSMSTFERTWRRAQFWSVIALKEDTQLRQFPLPATNDATGYFQALSDLDELRLLKRPIQHYQVFVNHWPAHHEAWFYLGNHLYKDKRYSQAMRAFHRAWALDSQARYLNNLVHVAAELDCSETLDAARQCVKRKGLQSDVLMKTLVRPPSVLAPVTPISVCPDVHCDD